MKRRTLIALISYGTLLICFGLRWPWMYQEALGRQAHPGSTDDMGAVKCLFWSSVWTGIAVVILLSFWLREISVWPKRMAVAGLFLLLGFIGFGFLRELWNHPSADLTGIIIYTVIVAVLGLSFFRETLSAWLCRIIIAGFCAYGAFMIIKDISNGGGRSDLLIKMVILAYCIGNVVTCLPFFPPMHLHRVGLILHNAWFLFFFLQVLLTVKYRDAFWTAIMCLYMAAGAFFAVYCFQMYDLRLLFSEPPKPKPKPKPEPIPVTSLG